MNYLLFKINGFYYHRLDIHFFKTNYDDMPKVIVVYVKICIPL